MASFPGNFNRNRITSDHNSIHPFAVPSRLSKNHCLSSFRTGISDLPLGCEPIYPHSPPLAILPASDSIPKPQACPARPLPGPRNHHLPFFEAISRTPLPQLLHAVQIGLAWLPSQSRDVPIFGQHLRLKSFATGRAGVRRDPQCSPIRFAAASPGLPHLFMRGTQRHHGVRESAAKRPPRRIYWLLNRLRKAARRKNRGRERHATKHLRKTFHFRGSNEIGSRSSCMELTSA